MPPEQRAPRARCHSVFRMPFKALIFCIYSKTAQNVPFLRPFQASQEISAAFDPPFFRRLI